MGLGNEVRVRTPRCQHAAAYACRPVLCRSLPRSRHSSPCAFSRPRSRSLLLRMQQHGLRPDEQSFAAVIRAGVGAPGSSQLAEALRPQLEAAARRKQPPRAGASSPSDSRQRHSAPLLSARSAEALLSATSLDVQPRGGAAGASGPGLRGLQQLLASGADLDGRSFVVALAGCAKRPGRWQEVRRARRRRGAGEAPARRRRGAGLAPGPSFCWLLPLAWRSPPFPLRAQAAECRPPPTEQALQLVGMLEVWMRQQPASSVSKDDLANAFSAAIAACDESRQKEAALQLLPRLAALAPPSAEAYNAAITSCRHGGDVETAKTLLLRMRRERLAVSWRTYNCLLQVLSAAGGRGDEALDLYEEVSGDGF